MITDQPFSQWYLLDCKTTVNLSSMCAGDMLFSIDYVVVEAMGCHGTFIMFWFPACSASETLWLASS